MVQDCLNRTAGHLWGIISNGSVLRLLRDTTSLTGAAYLEVDLAAMFDGELFEDFVLLYRLLHVSRFEVADGAPVSTCRMERWRTEAIEAGTRALDQLRDGVKDAIIALGTGFLKHPANAAFREDFDKDQAKRALLRLVYRLLFWFVAEDRDALHAPGTDEKTRQPVRGVLLRPPPPRRLPARGRHRPRRPVAGSPPGPRAASATEGGLPHLGLPGLGGIYDDTPTDAVLAGLELSNEQLLTAVKSLSRVRDKSTNRWRRIDYRNLGAEELGAIYESLLELVPDRDGPYTFVLRDAAGNDRKSTGSYYTPTSLIDCLLDSTLDPVLDDATKQAEIAATAAGTDVSAAIAEALLSVTVCDPACGSGHFLVAAARRIAKRVAAVREHNPEPTLESLRTALRDVITRCIYGVDLNPMAVELAKVSLWLEALDPGKPLSFLDAHVKYGNALIGATPKLIDEGIPDAAFKPVEGDDEKWARGSSPRPTRSSAPAKAPCSRSRTSPGTPIRSWPQDLLRITTAPAGSLRDVHRQAAAYQDWAKSAQRQRQLEIANAWCAAFMWRKTKDAPPAITYDVFQALKRDEPTLLAAAVADRGRQAPRRVRLLPLAPGVPRHLPCAGRRGSGHRPGHRLGRRVHGAARQPAVGQGRFQGQEYFSAVDRRSPRLAGQKRRDRIKEWEREHPEEG